jgi:hypothetical protein
MFVMGVFVPMVMRVGVDNRSMRVTVLMNEIGAEKKLPVCQDFGRDGGRNNIPLVHDVNYISDVFQQI